MIQQIKQISTQQIPHKIVIIIKINSKGLNREYSLNFTLASWNSGKSFAL